MESTVCGEHGIWRVRYMKSTVMESTCGRWEHVLASDTHMASENN